MPPQSPPPASPLDTETNLRRLLEAVSELAVYLLDLDGAVATWNAGAERLLGYSAAEAIGQPAARFYRPDEAAAGQPALALQTAAAHGTARAEHEWLRKGGSPFWAAVETVALRDEAGTLRGYGQAVRDATRQRLTDSALRISQARAQAISHATPNGLLAVADDGTITWANQRAEQMFGYEAGRLAGLTVDRLVPERLRAGHPLLRAGFNLDQRVRDMGIGRDLYALRRDGSEFPVEIGLSPLEGNRDRLTLALVVDITERKRAEEALIRLNAELEQRVAERTLALANANAELAANETKLRALFQVLPVGVSVVDAQRHIVESNPALARILKLTPDGLAAGSYAQRRYIRPDGTPMPLDELASQRAFDEQRTVLDVETGVLTESGETLWTLVSAAPLALEGLGAVVVTADITARKRTEQALLEGQQRYRALFEEARHKSQELTLRDLMHQALAREDDLPEVIRLLVEGIAQAFGYSLVSLYLREGEVLKLQHQVGYDHVICEVPAGQGVSWDVVRSGQALLLPDAHSHPAFLQAIEGIQSEICVPLFDAGQVVGVLNLESTHGVVLSEADLQTMLALGRQVEFALGRARLVKLARESQQRFASAFNHAAIGMALVAPEGRWLQANPALCRLVGYSEAELLTMRFQDITHPDDLEVDLEHVRQMLAGALQSYQMEKRYFHKAGHIVWVLLSVSLVRDAAGAPLYFISQIEDITERKQVEARLVGSLQEKEVLLREIHHRVKNNLQIVSSLLALQAEANDDPRLREAFDESQRRVRSMALIHEQLYRSPDLARIDFGEYVAGLFTYLRQTQGGPATQLQARVPPGTITLGIDQAIPLGLMVNELVTNSLKYAFAAGGAAPGPAQIWVAAAQPEPGQLRVEVGDNGAGLPEALDLDHPSSMGLQLVQSFVKQLRARLRVQRAPGTVFEITLPVK